VVAAAVVVVTLGVAVVAALLTSGVGWLNITIDQLAGASQGLHEHLQDEAMALELSSRSEDFREGLAAFGDKRPPEFTGR
jgi:2-(1,2-epoxy-1,2-dihydrophenyl)acetyl-CoA isomerase